MTRLAALATLAALVALAWPGAAHAATCTSGLKWQKVECLVNQERAAHGLQPMKSGWRLHISSRLEGARIYRCGHSHTPCGIPWTDSLRAAGALRCHSWAAGEDIGWGVSTPRAITAAWMASPTHRAIILSTRYTRIGVAHRLGQWVLHAGACT